MYGFYCTEERSRSIACVVVSLVFIAEAIESEIMAVRNRTDRLPRERYIIVAS